MEALVTQIKQICDWRKQ